MQNIWLQTSLYLHKKKKYYAHLTSPPPPILSPSHIFRHFFSTRFCVYFLASIQINSKSLHLISAKDNLWDSFFSGFLTIVLRKLNWSISFLLPFSFYTFHPFTLAISQSSSKAELVGVCACKCKWKLHEDEHTKITPNDEKRKAIFFHSFFLSWWIFLTRLFTNRST